jgi:predicted ribosomally synthesized peptide with SipW-like signal peptide
MIMTKKRSTKTALLMSVLSLFLCFSMLLGTTYAWFTDSVSSANNIITAGNLDVVLEYKTA